MPNKTVLPPPYLTLEDQNGAVITNGRVKFLVTGTSALAIVWADADGTVISANPLTVDAAGRYTVFVTPGEVYDVEYYDAHGALVKTVDAIEGTTTTSANNVDQAGTYGQAVVAGQVLYLSDGTVGPAGLWFLAVGTAPSQSILPTLGIAMVPGAALGPGTIRTAGLCDNLTGLVVGARYYVSDVAGTWSLTPGTYARIIGQAATASSLVFHANPPALDAPNTQTVSTTGTIAQLVPTARTIQFSNATLTTVQGIKAGYHGQRLRIQATGAGQVDFVNNSASAATGDKLANLVSSGVTSLAPTTSRGACEYEYDKPIGFWRLIGHEQGGFITPAFVAGDYAGNGGQTWTVAAGQVQRCAYYLRGRQLQMQLRLIGTTVGGVADPYLSRMIPGGYSGVGGAGGALAASGAGVPLPSPSWAQTATQVLFIASPTWILGAVDVSLDATLDVT